MAMPDKGPGIPDEFITMVKAAVPISAVVSPRIALKKNGAEKEGLCPFHKEKSPSFKVNDAKGFYHCFGCGVHGDHIDFLTEHDRMPWREAVAHLAEMAGAEMPDGSPKLRSSNVVQHPAVAAQKAPEESFHPIIPPPADAPDPDVSRFDHAYAYRDVDGTLLRYVLRNDATGKKRKTIFPLTYGTVRPAGDTGWHHRHPPENRSLYGLEDLAAHPEAPVIIPEGEKDRDAAKAYLPDCAVITWSAGTNAVSKSDWSPIRGRRVIVWPDNDEPGRKAADEIAGLLSASNDVWIVDLSDLAEKAGAADVGAFHLGWLEARATQWAPDDAVVPIEPDDDRDYSFTPDPIETDHGGPEVGAPTPLGYDRGVYYYLSAATRQVTGLTPPTHNKAGLMSLAGLAHFWERSRFYGKKGVDWDAAADWLMRACEDRGVFNPSRLRGRGAWLDKDPDTGADRSIVHLGDRVFVNGEPTSLAALRSKYVYEAAVPMMDRFAEPLTTTQAHELYKLCANLRWEIPVHGRLLAGWIAIAPICGALHWRPSIWITGASGSGKSWVVDQIISKALGETLVGVQSKTSEAGIRQTLGSDARPVLFDEAEQEDLQSRSRMQSVLDLVRQSSSEGGAEIVKGTQSQTGAKRYRIRSVFAFSSINVGIEHFADESRITRLPLVSHNSQDPEEVAKAEEHFEAINKAALETITPDFPPRLVARSAGLIPVIRANALTFAAAAASHLGNRRIGDQIGVLLAGAYSLFSTKTLTFDQALEWIRKQDWTGTASEQGEQDHCLLLRHLMQSTIRVTLHATHHAADRVIGEVVEAALSYSGEHGISLDEARTVLKRHGMRIQTAFDEAVCDVQGKPGVWVANKHTALTRLLNDTPWRASWAQALSRIPGAIKSTKPIRISAGGVTRAVFVPLSAINEDDQ